MNDPRPIDPRRIEVLDDAMAQVLRSMTGAQRLEIAFGMFASARKMLTEHLSTVKPEWTPEEVATEVSRRLALGDP